MLNSKMYLFILILACAPCSVHSQTKLAAQTENLAVEEAMRHYAATLKETKPTETADCYTADGELLLPGMSAVHGPPAISAFLSPLSSTIEVESIEMKTDLLEVHGQSADQWGTYNQLAGEKGKEKKNYKGRYAAIWQKSADGKWLIRKLMMQPL